MTATIDQLYIVGSLVVLAIFVLFLGIKIVPQGQKFVVERLGKYSRTLVPGLNFIIPFIDTISQKVSTKDQQIDVPSQEVISSDNAVIMINGTAFINVIEPSKAIYGVDDFKAAIRTLVQTSLRSIIGEMTIDDCLSSREKIRAKLIESISADVSDWGIVVKTIEVQDIKPSDTMVASMEDQAAAERSRRASVTQAEGDKKAAILKSEGELAAAQNEAKAKLALAEASAKAIKVVSDSIENKELPVMYLLGERYIDNLSDISKSESAKTIVLPADLPAAIRGLMGR